VNVRADSGDSWTGTQVLAHIPDAGRGSRFTGGQDRQRRTTVRLSITLLSASIGVSKRNLLDWTLIDSDEPGAAVRVTWRGARRRTR
jgi:hypothetical protein